MLAAVQRHRQASRVKAKQLAADAAGGPPVCAVQGALQSVVNAVQGVPIVGPILSEQRAPFRGRGCFVSGDGVVGGDVQDDRHVVPA